MSKYRRIVPVLILSDGYLVKPVKFGKHQYIGDPINAVKIFNEMEADELILLDKDPSRRKTNVNFKLIEEIASEAFMPVAYGGGVNDTETGLRLSRIGIEKVVLNTASVTKPELISDLAKEMGSQGVVVCIDYKNGFRGKRVYIAGGMKKTEFTPVQLSIEAARLGAGEILLQDIQREGTLKGYDTETLAEVRKVVSLPLAILGGAGTLEDFKSAFNSGASAACAGTIFVTNGPHKAVLINYPDPAKVDTFKGY